MGSDEAISSAAVASMRSGRNSRELARRGLSICAAALMILAPSSSPATARVRDFDLSRPIPQIARVRPSDAAKSLIYYLSCMAFLAQNLPTPALTACNRAVELDPHEAQSLELRGSVLRSLGETDRAIVDFSLAIELKPDDAAGYELRGRAFLESKRLVAALADFDNAIALDPFDADVFAARGSVFQEMSRYRRAIRDFGHAIALAPEEGAFWNARCWVRMAANVELRSALSDCRAALKRNPDSAHTFDSLGWVYYRLNDAQAAVQAFDTALAKSPRLASSWYGRGLSHMELGDGRRGAAEVAKAQVLDPGIAQRFRTLGIVAPVVPVQPLPRPSADKAS